MGLVGSPKGADIMETEWNDIEDRASVFHRRTTFLSLLNGTVSEENTVYIMFCHTKLLLHKIPQHYAHE